MPVRRSIPCLLLVSLCLPANAEVGREIVTLDLTGGYYDFDRRRGFDNTPMVGFNLGLALSPRWAVMLEYHRLAHEDSDVGRGSEVSVINYHLNGYHYWHQSPQLRPFVTAGIGEIEIETPGRTRHETQLNLALGLEYALTPRWALQARAGGYYSFDQSWLEHATQLGVRFRFGEP